MFADKLSRSHHHPRLVACKANEMSCDPFFQSDDNIRELSSHTHNHKCAKFTTELMTSIRNLAPSDVSRSKLALLPHSPYFICMKFGAGISSGLSNVLGFALTGLGFAATGGALGACGIGMAAFTGGGLLAKHVLDDRRADFNKQITSMCKRMEDELRLDARIADKNNQDGLTALLKSLPGDISALGLTAEDIVAQGYNTNAIAGNLVRRLSEKDTAYAPDTFIGASTHKILSSAFDSVKGADEFVKQTTLACREKILADLDDIKKGLSDRQKDADLKHDAMMKLLQQEKGVPLAAMKAFLVSLGAKENIGEAQVPGFLERFADDYLKLETQLARHSQTGPGIQALRDAARIKMQAGDLNGARADLNTARTLRLERRQEDAKEEALLLDDLAGMDKLELNYAEAAEKYAEAAILVTFDPDLKAGYLEHQANVLYGLGLEFGDNTALEASITLYQQDLLPLFSRYEKSQQWAKLQLLLGNALRVLGKRESGTARLEGAAQAYKQALLERTRERVPLNWAETQNNLGIALKALGERESGTARLEDAVLAYEKALLERTRERVPLGWAETQNNLGNALRTLGERENSTARLEDAVQAFERALLEWTRERVPLNWAITQNNLGSALAALGQRESNAARLESAVAAFEQALLEWTRERVPLHWATTQSNLGSALSVMGERERDAARLEDAVQAFEQALLELTQERVPLQWAAIQNNIGEALRALGERESGTKRLEQAAHAFDLALGIFATAGADYYVGFARENLTNVKALIKARQKA